MSLLSEYEKRTAWKYNAVTGRFSTHPALINKVDAAGRQEKLCGTLAQPVPGASCHMTLHDLISPEQTDATAVFADEARTAYTAKYLREVTLSLEEAGKRVDEMPCAMGCF